MIHFETKNGELLPIADLFVSLQGEGFNTGKPVFFVRLGGCNVRCSWCDTKESWDGTSFPLLSVTDLYKKIADSGQKRVVITGGEPALYNLGPICNILKDGGIERFMETSGTSPIRGDFEWIALSPKRHMPPLKENLERASELKVVITSPEDFSWAEENRKYVNEGCKLYLQPEWGAREEILSRIHNYLLSNPEWRLSVQLHKYLNIK